MKLLLLTDEYAAWLHSVMQNPLDFAAFEDPSLEDSQVAKMRKFFFDNTSDAGAVSVPDFTLLPPPNAEEANAMLVAGYWAAGIAVHGDSREIATILRNYINKQLKVAGVFK